MPNLFRAALIASTFLFLPAQIAIAQKLPDSLEPDSFSHPMSQVTNVSELSDVSPNDWAYQALQSIVERYGIVAGYPERTFRGHRSMSRYEFAAGLNSAMNRMDQILKTLPEQYVTQQDLAVLKKLQVEFAQELSIVKNQLTLLESEPRSSSSFSETTKFSGEVLFTVTGVGRADKADGSGDSTDSGLTVGNRVRLNFDTSFFGKDRLRTRLQSGNIARTDRAAGTDMARLSYQADSEGAIEVSRLEYQAPIGKDTTLYVSAIGGSLNDFANTFNPFISGSAEGSVSRFGQRNPIYRLGGGSGIGLEYEFTDDIALTIGYLGSDVDDPNEGFGKSSYSAIAQLSLEFSKTFGLGLTYVRSFNSIDTATGSELANDPFDDESDAVIADSFGIQAAIALNRRLSISGWAGLTRARATDLEGDPSASIFNWAVTIAFPDLFKEGSLGGLVIGQPPKLTRNDFSPGGQTFRDRDTSLHFEAFYRYRVNDFISITPGIVLITNPEHRDSNNDIFIGTIRTTFNF
ncbi:iron uptake porin [Leptolyngbya sp. AN03gr2]|uniref:iron uptake porin n=1 Tax=unclassified Leptolyngbya TaxID=2650499 RepID=UPI003D3191F1